MSGEGRASGRAGGSHCLLESGLRGRWRPWGWGQAQGAPSRSFPCGNRERIQTTAPPSLYTPPAGAQPCWGHRGRDSTLASCPHFLHPLLCPASPWTAGSRAERPAWPPEESLTSREGEQVGLPTTWAHPQSEAFSGPWNPGLLQQPALRLGRGPPWPAVALSAVSSSHDRGMGSGGLPPRGWPPELGGAARHLKLGPTVAMETICLLLPPNEIIWRTAIFCTFNIMEFRKIPKPSQPLILKTKT